MNRFIITVIMGFLAISSLGNWGHIPFFLMANYSESFAFIQGVNSDLSVEAERVSIGGGPSAYW